MPKVRLAVSAVVAVGLLAGACGGDDPDAEATDTETVGSETAAIGSGAEEGATGGDSTEADPTADSVTTDPEPEPEAPPVLIGAVELGDRFPWCATVNAIWQAFDEEAEWLDIMTASLQEAQQAAATATDELDVIEAQNAERLAQGAYDEVVVTYEDAYTNLANYMLATRLYLDFQLFVSTAAVVIDFLIRDDEEFFAQYYSRTQEQIDANKSQRMSQYLEILNAETGATIFGRYGRTRRTSDPWDEAEIVAMGRAWEAFDAVVGDVPAFEMFEVNAGLLHALRVYGLAHSRHVDTFLEENRPATLERFSFMEELEPKAAQAEQDIMALFINNDEARQAYQQSYAESCRES